MANYLLDSNIIIDALNDHRGRRGLLRKLLDEHHALGCCPINVIEVCAGMRPQEEHLTEEMLASFDFYEISWETARQAGLLKREWAKRGQTLALADVTIAAVAIYNDLTLITDNVKDYPMPDVKIYGKI